MTVAGFTVPRQFSFTTRQVVGTLRTLAYRDHAISALSARFDPVTGRAPAAPTARPPNAYASPMCRDRRRPV
ncbi:hypothetical protein CBI38_16625 [Rhodococcus oxybenzonivorans]|uniref:Uncharacterized protein n=1 Tax=Rhodococcus oxybenzonivorans TaxID=1990687 RepID=A0A2S2BWQ0_9NOCA|nr:hypothetical protein CBI38_16625 [Rhodococcus oxybenzonivorans]